MSPKHHFDDFWSTLTFEPNAEAVIAERIAHFRDKSARLMGEVSAFKLGEQPQSRPCVQQRQRQLLEA